MFGTLSKKSLDGSAPDLSSDIQQEERLPGSRRKRGHDSEFSEAFDQFTDKITAAISDWRAEFTRETSQINEKLNKLTDFSQQVKSELASMKQDYTEIRGSVTRLERTYKEIQQEASSLKESVQFNSDQYDTLTKKLDDHSKEIKCINAMNTEITELKKQNRKLMANINANDQRERLFNIELVGLPECDNENLYEILLQLGRHTKVSLTNEDIIHVNRVSSKSKIQGRPKNIIAKLRTRQLKDNIISQARKCRLTTKDLGVQGRVAPVYVNEHLTLYNKDLLKKTKEAANLKQHQYVWSKNGRIYVRKASTMPAILITEEEDLKTKIV